MFSLMNGEKGFTLIEIMVVLVILGVLATISVPTYTKYVRKAKISEAISNVGSYGTAIRIYKMENGKWPEKTDLPDIDLNEKYFTLSWSIDETDLTINIADTDAFAVDCDCTYVIVEKTLKGTWHDNATTNCLEEYVPYLVP